MTLNITVAPVDLPLVEHTLPHQLRQWGGQVADVQIIVDLHRSKGRFGAAAEERRSGLERLLAGLERDVEKVSIVPVDYSVGARREVAARFFGGEEVPTKNHYGGPFYSYFYGWHRAPNDLVFHMDCDMLFGGGSQAWLEEAVALLRARPEALLASPFPGPPLSAEGDLPEAALQRHSGGDSSRRPRRDAREPGAYHFHSVSTRLLLFDRQYLLDRIGPLPVQRARLRSRARAALEGHAPYALPEDTLSRAMRARGLTRIDLLGRTPGMWSLHPPMRSPEFYASLPRLVRRVEQGEVPAGQRGDFDVNDSMIDWSSARHAAAQEAWWRRLARRPLEVLRGG